MIHSAIPMKFEFENRYAYIRADIVNIEKVMSHQ